MPAGRKPLPTSVKLARGNPGKRKLNTDVEALFSGKPVMPPWIPKDAKAEWKRIVAELEGLNILKSTDQAVLAAYTVAYGRWKSAEAIIDKEGQTVQEPITNKAGDVVGYKTRRHPATLIAKDERASMQRLASSFGFDPSSRSRVQMTEAKEKVVEEDFEADLYATPASNNRRSVH
jgi:P27 family predicted phage terminase small subunit